MSGTERPKFFPTMRATLHARNYRECLERHSRYKQLYSAQEFRFTEKHAEFQIETPCPCTPNEPPPALIIDADSAILVELGGHGTMTKSSSTRVELSQPNEGRARKPITRALPPRIHALIESLSRTPHLFEELFVATKEDGVIREVNSV